VVAPPPVIVVSPSTVTGTAAAPLNGAEKVAALLAATPEYFQSRGGGTNNGFLNALYMDALNRAPTLAEQQQFAQSGYNRLQAAAQVFGGKAYREKLVRGYYQQFLGHAVGDDVVNAAVNLLMRGGRDEQVIAAIVGSAEYFAQV